jgi:hypothetical protein
MLELLIALFLVGLCALPLAEIPMKTLRDEISSAYRMQFHHYADLAFAEFKEKIYQQEIPWKQICSPREAKSAFKLEKTLIDPIGGRAFERKATFYSVGKKGKKGEEIRLVTFIVSFKTKEKRFSLFRGKKGVKKERYAPCSFTYKMLVVKSSLEEQQPLELPPTTTPKGQAVG